MAGELIGVFFITHVVWYLFLDQYKIGSGGGRFESATDLKLKPY